MINCLFKIDEAITRKIYAVPHFKDSIYANLNIDKTLDFNMRQYIQPLSKHFKISDCVVVDCGAGYGWFSFAYVIAGGKAAIAVDVDKERLLAAKEIAKILSVDDRINFIVSPIQSIPLSNDEADLFVSIETLEHVGKKNIRPALQRIRDVASKGILVTTPNKIFPIVSHDTRLPFIHWLPPNKRAPFAKIFKRENLNAEFCDFVSPFDLTIILDKFKPVSKCTTFQSFKDYMNQFPLYLPYGSEENQRYKTGASFLIKTYYRIVSSIFKTNAFWFMPNFSTIFVRK